MFEPSAADGIYAADLELPGLSDIPSDPAGRVPGLALIALLTSLPADADSDYEALDRVAAWDRVSSWAAARSLDAVSDFVRWPAEVAPDPESYRHLCKRRGRVAREHGDDELAVRVGVSRRMASRRIDAVVALVDMPRTRDAHRAGLLDSLKVQVLVEECALLEPEHRADVEAAVVDKRAGELAPARLRERVRRAVLSADPEAAAMRSARARAQRCMHMEVQPDGMATLFADLPAADALTIQSAVDAAATGLRNRPDESRTMDQLRADLLVAPFREALRTGVLPGAIDAAGEPVTLARRRGEPVAVQVIVPMSVLLGISRAPGELVGYGPITAEVARELAGEGTWRRLLTDDAGQVVDAGTTTYRPPASLQRLIEARDAQCRFPGCGVAAQRCDLDHVVPFPNGPTSSGNLMPLCRRHHRFKHGDDDPGTAALAQRSTDGAVTWVLPTGHQSVVQPRASGDPDSDAELLTTFTGVVEDDTGVWVLPDPRDVPPEYVG